MNVGSSPPSNLVDWWKVLTFHHGDTAGQNNWDPCCQNSSQPGWWWVRGSKTTLYILGIVIIQVAGESRFQPTRIQWNKRGILWPLLKWWWIGFHVLGPFFSANVRYHPWGNCFQSTFVTSNIRIFMRWELHWGTIAINSNYIKNCHFYYTWYFTRWENVVFLMPQLD